MAHRKLTTVTTVVALSVAAGAGAVSTGAGAASSKTVVVKDDVFAPKSLTVKKGTTLVLVWKGKNKHNVVGTGAANFASKLQRSGSLRVKLSKKGTVKLICTVHPPGMKATIKVK